MKISVWIGLLSLLFSTAQARASCTGYSGPVSIRWDGRNKEGVNLPSGIYFYQLRTLEGQQTKDGVAEITYRDIMISWLGKMISRPFLFS